MKIRFARQEDNVWLGEHDHHVSGGELENLINLQRILIAEADGAPVGWLRWNLFWDNTPFMNMLYVLDGSRNKGVGSALTEQWERILTQRGYEAALTSTLSGETAQHFYRRHGYRDAGVLLLPGEDAEIFFYKKL